MISLPAEQIVKASNKAEKRLLKAMNTNGYWEGLLSSSALATSIAIFALTRSDENKYHAEIKRGLNWLSRNINPDQGWGDSPESQSNLSTTLLVWSALSAAPQGAACTESVRAKAEEWLRNEIIHLEPETITKAILRNYGNDRTFSAPILAFCALAGKLGNESKCWRHVPQLPFELAAFPHQLFKWLRLPVVSYALPALIAIGLVRHQHKPTWNPIGRSIRNRLTNRLLDKLSDIQPENGGFLEATPLTGFVIMSLGSSGFKDHPVVRKGIHFLLESQRSDGSWPIDTHLATWVTTLAVNALSGTRRDALTYPQRMILAEHLLSQQFREEHPFTHAAPGGWSWIHLPGGVPDADDTSGVLLALKNLNLENPSIQEAASKGIGWLLGLQNKDGGFPTFCKGWGKLPFDRSCPDITAHALQAFIVWRDDMNFNFQKRIDKAVINGLRYLGKSQRENGSWVPLWFGCQGSDTRENPVYGSAQVITALFELSHLSLGGLKEMIKKGYDFLLRCQNEDGGWGSDANIPSTIEETALALKAISGYQEDDENLSKGFRWLVENTRGEHLPSAPIGLYFASLWYDEALYPLIFTCSALNSGCLIKNQIKGGKQKIVFNESILTT